MLGKEINCKDDDDGPPATDLHQRGMRLLSMRNEGQGLEAVCSLLDQNLIRTADQIGKESGSSFLLLLSMKAKSRTTFRR